MTTWAEMCEEIESLQAPKRECLVECEVAGCFSPRNDRLYEVTVLDPPMYQYRSSISGGQEHYTVENQGPHGEPVDAEPRTILVTEGGGYIGHFINWDWFCDFLKQMRATKIHIEYFD